MPIIIDIIVIIIDSIIIVIIIIIIDIIINNIVVRIHGVITGPENGEPQKGSARGATF